MIHSLVDSETYFKYDDEKAREMISNGEHLMKSEHIPELIWQIMERCWKKNPKERPEIKAVLEDLLTIQTPIPIEFIHIPDPVLVAHHDASYVRVDDFTLEDSQDQI